MAWTAFLTRFDTKNRVIVETSPSKQTDYDAAAYAFSDTKYADASKGVPNGGINVQIEFKTFQPDFSYFPPVQMNIISKVIGFHIKFNLMLILFAPILYDY